jgi:hypothetical protein
VKFSTRQIKKFHKPQKQKTMDTGIQKHKTNDNDVAKKCIRKMIKYFGCCERVGMLQILKQIENGGKPDFIHVVVVELLDYDIKRHYYFENNETNWKILNWISETLVPVEDYTKTYIEPPERNNNDGYVHVLCAKCDFHQMVKGTLDEEKVKSMVNENLKKFENEKPKIDCGEEVEFSIENFLLTIHSMPMIQDL